MNLNYKTNSMIYRCKHFFYALAAMTIVTSCNNTSDENNEKKSNNASEDSNNITNHCYSQQDKDSIWLQISINGDSVSGNYLTKIQGKDKNTGSLRGKIFGDTILANYTFYSEGIQSIRQVAFLRKEDSIIEGFGEITDENGVMVFKNIHELDFNNNMVLLETPCDQ